MITRRVETLVLKHGDASMSRRLKPIAVQVIEKAKVMCDIEHPEGSVRVAGMVHDLSDVAGRVGSYTSLPSTLPCIDE